eukprot:3500064-Rhodomonas_salina.1
MQSGIRFFASSRVWHRRLQTLHTLEQLLRSGCSDSRMSYVSTRYTIAPGHHDRGEPGSAVLPSPRLSLKQSPPQALTLLGPRTQALRMSLLCLTVHLPRGTFPEMRPTPPQTQREHLPRQREQERESEREQEREPGARARAKASNCTWEYLKGQHGSRAAGQYLASNLHVPYR